MSSWVPVFELEPQTSEMSPLTKRRGVTVVTQHGRAVTFGVSQDRTEHFMKSMALGKNHELMAAMQEHKAERLNTPKMTKTRR
jgi:hypothetical protein